MIRRVWHGFTTRENAEAYERLLRDEIFAGIAARELPGYHGLELLRRDLGTEVEFVTILRFATLDSVRAFAGQDHEVAVVPPAARALLLRFDARAAHFELRDSRPAVSPEDRAAIDELRARDARAARAQDFTTLRTVIDDEAVMLPPGAPRQCGIGISDVAPTHDVLDYVMEFDELEIRDDRAIEWGTIRGAMRGRETGAVESSSYHVMRILRRQPDGTFKVYRSIWAPSD